MTTLIMKIYHNHIPAALPTTGRGRALYTVDWILRGQPQQKDYDDTQLSLSDL